ncbi:hypothetical protein [Streptomyces sp. JJ38]|uniref:hypothetical protein n=1 Tax=Streptomyces sp. JJ38 TaxID=2738128 RepID=UPI0027DEDD21|nr:hypothetical protein [Streptomyces sp. JJ38]MBW1598387.1 hypothetical protein [Streptomyces sp. JJ38]
MNQGHASTPADPATLTGGHGTPRSAGHNGHRVSSAHIVLMSLVVVVPIVKVAYTIGGGDAVREAFTGMELGNWTDVLIGMVLTDPLLASGLAVVLSRLVFVLFMARGTVPLSGGRGQAAQRRTLTVLGPAAVAIVITSLFGPWWGLATGLVAYALNLGVLLGHRVRHGDSGRRPPTWQRRTAALEHRAVLALALVALPLLAFGSALDGRAWTTIVQCRVTDGTRTESDRLIELGRKGNGVVGWNLDSEQVSNGTGCTTEESLHVRDPWWRGG